MSNHEQVNCTFTLFGIVSIGPKICGIPGAAGKFYYFVDFCLNYDISLNLFIGGYVNVYKFLDWIEGIVWKDEV